MAKAGEPIRVNKVLDLRPRLFSLPVTIVIPMMFLLPIIGIICHISEFSGLFSLFVVITSVAVYFFLFGQEYWRLLAKFQSVPNWVRADVKAIPFSLSNESNKKGRTHKRR